MRDNAVILLAGLAAAFALMHSRALAFGAVLTSANVYDLARQQIAVGNFDVSADMVRRVAWIESHFDPSASRYEAALGDASTGLMQTLLSTARWLATDMGYTAYGVPTFNTLLGPQASLYFGAAYLDYLSTYSGQSRSEEWMIRAYNGGPGFSTSSTNNYWAKYQAAKSEVG